MSTSNVRRFYVIVRSLLLSSLLASTSACAVREPQARSGQVVGGGCDGCELMFVGMPAVLAPVARIGVHDEPGERLQLTGRVVLEDGRTSASGVILYFWQTDAAGHYTLTAEMPTGARRHGHLRGWVRTGPSGEYTVSTIRPAPYPGDRIPAHIHIAVKEGSRNAYYIDDIVFDDDPLVTAQVREAMPHRGGSGEVRPVRGADGGWSARRDIVLGKNVPAYR